MLRRALLLAFMGVIVTAPPHARLHLAVVTTRLKVLPSSAVAAELADAEGTNSSNAGGAGHRACRSNPRGRVRGQGGQGAGSACCSAAASGNRRRLLVFEARRYTASTMREVEARIGDHLEYEHLDRRHAGDDEGHFGQRGGGSAWGHRQARRAWVANAGSNLGESSG